MGQNAGFFFLKKGKSPFSPIDMEPKIIKKFLNFIIIERNIRENGYDYILRNDQTLEWFDGFQ